MTVVKILSSKSATKTLHYVLDGPPKSAALVDRRVLAQGDLGMDDYHDGAPVDGDLASSAFWATRHVANKDDKATQAKHLIFSFDETEVPTHDAQGRPLPQEDLTKSAEMVKELIMRFLKKVWPDMAQAVIAVQADSKAQRMHAHVVLNTVNRDGRVFNTRYTKATDLHPAFDQYLQAQQKTVTRTDPAPYRVSDREYWGKKRAAETGKYVWKDDLRNRIKDAMMQANSLAVFKEILAANGVAVVERRQSTGKKDPQGHIIRRSAYTYSFADPSGKTHKARDDYQRKPKNGGQPAQRGLGAGFTPEALESVITYRTSHHETTPEPESQPQAKPVDDDTVRTRQIQRIAVQIQEDAEDNDVESNLKEVETNVKRIQSRNARHYDVGSYERATQQKQQQLRQRKQRQQRQETQVESTVDERPTQSASRSTRQSTNPARSRQRPIEPGAKRHDGSSRASRERSGRRAQQPQRPEQPPARSTKPVRQQPNRIDEGPSF